MTRQRAFEARHLRQGLCVRCGRKRSKLYKRWCLAHALARRQEARVRMAELRGVPEYGAWVPGGPGRRPFVQP